MRGGRRIHSRRGVSSEWRVNGTFLHPPPSISLPVPRWTMGESETGPCSFPPYVSVRVHVSRGFHHRRLHRSSFSKLRPKHPPSSQPERRTRISHKGLPKAPCRRSTAAFIRTLGTGLVLMGEFDTPRCFGGDKCDRTRDATCQSLTTWCVKRKSPHPINPIWGRLGIPSTSTFLL